MTKNTCDKTWLAKKMARDLFAIHLRKQPLPNYLKIAPICDNWFSFLQSVKNCGAPPEGGLNRDKKSVLSTVNWKAEVLSAFPHLKIKVCGNSDKRIVSERMCSRRKNDRDIYLNGNGTDCESLEETGSWRSLQTLPYFRLSPLTTRKGTCETHSKMATAHEIHSWRNPNVGRGGGAGGGGQGNLDLFSYFFILLKSVEMSGHNKLRDTLEYTFSYKHHYDFYAK